jgi:hypothetical protein
MQNIWRTRALGGHQHSKELAQRAKLIDDCFKGQQSDLIKVKSSVETISEKMVKLESEINQASKFL